MISRDKGIKVAGQETPRRTLFLLTPFYCEWLCPFKTVTEYFEVTTFQRLVQAIIFISLCLWSCSRRLFYM